MSNKQSIRALDRVVWAKGMLLTPQHFQAHGNYIDDAVQFRFVASLFANWGILSVACDEDELPNGQFRLTEFRAVLPDGTLIDCPSVDRAPSARPFSQYFPPNQDVLDVFIAIPERVQGQNVSISANGDSSSRVRYTASVREIRDENGLDEDKPVQFAEKNLTVLFGNQPGNGFVRIRAAQIVRTAQGSFALSQDFIPPLLNIAASGALMSLLKRQIEILGSKAQSLGAGRRQRGKAAADFNVSDSANFWLLHTVNSFLPELTHIWNVRRGHPEPLYVSMLKLAGALATFSFETDVRSLPAYDHDNLGTCFAQLDAAIRALVETILPSRFVAISLKQNQRIWSGDTEGERWGPNSQMYLAIAAEMGVDDLIRKTPNLVKIAASDEINNLITHALPAITIRHSTAPSALPYRVDCQYFAVNQSGRLWEAVVRTKKLSLFIPPELQGARPELFVVLS